MTVTVNQIIFTPHPISYWLENGDGITQDLLEKAAEGHDNNNNEDEWSFNLGNFRVPVEFDVSDSENDTKGILEAYHTTESGGGGENSESNNNDDSRNAYDQLAAQLLAAKLNIGNGIPVCESIETTIEHSDTTLGNAQYDGPGSIEDPTDERREYSLELMKLLDGYNNNINSCV